MLYPFENYLKALLIKGHGTNSVMDRIRALKLTPPDEDEIEAKREELMSLLPDEALIYITPGPKYNFSMFLEKAKGSLSLLGIDELLPIVGGKRDIEWEDALMIMVDNITRAAAMSCIVRGHTDDEIIDMLTVKQGVRMSARSLELFKKYFWNITCLTRIELYHYISCLEHNKLKELLVDAFHHRDNQLKWKISKVNSLTLEEILAEIMNEAFAKFKNGVGSDDSDNVNKVIKWAELAIKAAEKHKTITNKDASNLVATLQFKLRKMSQEDIPTADESPDEVA
jgi:hypothetical protein